tara:strand:+ start:26 stop:382 length:357 start_codon:yes stop_codon:yes gene_type:complete
MNNQRKRFRPRQHKNGFRRRNGSGIKSGGISYFQGNSGNGNFQRNGSLNNPFSVEKAIQKYQQLAKDALSSGDPILSENYFQHADHFSRRLKELNSKTKDFDSVKEEKKEIKADSSKS